MCYGRMGYASYEKERTEFCVVSFEPRNGLPNRNEFKGVCKNVTRVTY